MAQSDLELTILAAKDAASEEEAAGRVLVKSLKAMSRMDVGRLSDAVRKQLHPTSPQYSFPF